MLFKSLSCILLFKSLFKVTDAHLAAVCTATHASRPQIVTFLYGTYHTSPNTGSSVPGNAFIRTPQGKVHTFQYDSFCAIPVDSNNIPVPEWKTEANITYYRERLVQNCICENILHCGSYDEQTGTCSSTEDECVNIDPWDTQIDCYKQNRDVPPSEGAWTQIAKNDDTGNCAYGSSTGVEFTNHVRTFYTAQLNNIFSGIFELWSNETDVNLDPSTLYLRDSGQVQTEKCLIILVYICVHIHNKISP